MESLLLKFSLVTYLLATLVGGWGILRPSNMARWTSTTAMAFAFVSQAAALIVRSAQVGTIAITTFPDQVSVFALFLTGVYLLTQVRFRLAVLAAVVGPIGFIGVLAALVAHGGAPDPPPELRSPWLFIHVTLAYLGNAAFALACLVSLVYLWEERQLKAHSVGRFLWRLPSLERLDTVNFKFLTWGFVLLTLSIVIGVLWAELYFGRFWSWEPRTIWTMIIWVIYAVLLQGRFTVGWGGRQAATLTIVGFGVLFVAFIGVNVLAPGQHADSFG
ncbi:MAG: cytochrome c biogenesis protein [Candidatus Binatia bacterium]|nr:cytochrome c biogenesis protein [Candidatus Binatia bacterium]